MKRLSVFALLCMLALVAPIKRAVDEIANAIQPAVLVAVRLRIRLS